MQSRQSTEAGKVNISDSAIRALVNSAVQGCYGIVDVSRNGRRWALAHRSRKPSIEIQQREESLFVRIPVVVEHGLPVVTVAQNLVKSVTYQLQQALGSVQTQVEVQVIELRQHPTATGSLA
jgi:uncharacterized alkaline shock family protein YloU